MLNLYNTLSKTIEKLDLPTGQTVNMYSCGPTVYDFAHIGNLRSFISADVLYRTLKANGTLVSWVMNITDIDDKTIKGTVAEYGPSATVADLVTYTNSYYEAFLADLKAVSVSVDEIKFIKVTDAIPEIQDLIIALIDKGFAYTADDGSTYFSIEKYQAEFGNYGQLVGEKFLEGKQIGARVKVDEYDKDNLSDFALWKAWSEEDANIYWDHPALGKGRPGWHIECSAINRMAFGGEPTHIHTGGVDLIFPHHTNEIAQSTPMGPFVKYWMHIEHLMVNGQKMSKSANNFYTLRDIEERGFTGADLRLTFLQSSYHTQQNFTWDSIQASANALKKLHPTSTTEAVATDFMGTLNDNLNTAGALAIAMGHKQNLSAYAQILGLVLPTASELEVPAEVAVLLQERAEARANKNFAKSDELRDKITQLGYQVKDSEQGQELEKI